MNEQKQKYTELESILQRTVEKQNKRIANLQLDLDLAHSQIEIMKEQQHAEQKNKIAKDKKDDKTEAK